MTGARAQAVGTNMPDRQMTAEQDAMLFSLTRLGLEWVKGDIPFEDVKRRIGDPQHQFDQSGTLELTFFVEDVMEVTFEFRRPDEGASGESIPSGFSIDVYGDVQTNLPYETFDQLGLHRLVYGEKIDGVRSESRGFMFPVAMGDPMRHTPLNTISFAYRQLLPDDSPYDIYAGFTYLAELVREKGPWDLSIIRRAVNLRRLAIGRVYLSPEELDARDKALRDRAAESKNQSRVPTP
jgi:hypothetical protein